MIAGVCGGLADYLDVDPVFVRLATVLLAFANGIGIVAYAVLWIITPRQSRRGRPQREIVQENVENLKDRPKELGEEVRGTFHREGQVTSTFSEEEVREPRPRHRIGRPYLVGAILIIVGLLLLTSNFSFFWWLSFGKLWPLILVAAGVALLLGRRRKG